MNEQEREALPPLPEWTKRDDLGGLVPSEIRSEMIAYARAALAAEVPAGFVFAGEIVTYTGDSGSFFAPFNAPKWADGFQPSVGTRLYRETSAMLAATPAPAPEATPAPAPKAVCTCPSGDGSLHWPCPAHPPEAVTPAQAQQADSGGNNA